MILTVIWILFKRFTVGRRFRTNWQEINLKKKQGRRGGPFLY